MQKETNMQDVGLDEAASALYIHYLERAKGDYLRAAYSLLVDVMEVRKKNDSLNAIVALMQDAVAERGK